ncbi:MAG: hypothetical protein KGN16_10415 [Burkholderiales bacterium]|nr:hypothetical protein [Burkholderiales bacterium]
MTSRNHTSTGKAAAPTTRARAAADGPAASLAAARAEAAIVMGKLDSALEASQAGAPSAAPAAAVTVERVNGAGNKLADQAYNVWALLNAAGARIDEAMNDDGAVQYDDVGEIKRLIRVAAGLSYSLGDNALDLGAKVRGVDRG